MFRKALKKIIFSTRGKTSRTEIGGGILEERRRLLWVPFAAWAGALLLPPGISAGQKKGPLDGAGIGWEEFLERISPTARELHKDSSPRGQDAYLFWLASMAARLDFASIPKARLASFANLKPPVETGLAHRGSPFFVIEWKMSPDAYLPPHNHPNISVCTVCTGGRARIRNFDPEGRLPGFDSQKEFSIRETHDEILSPGRINTLSARRDNIHTFRAGPEGASGIDITTYHGRDEGFSFLEIARRPRDSEKRIYRAVWKKP